MEPKAPASASETPPPEARLIRTAREAVGMTASQAAEATGGAVSATYWRDIERGHGGRRGQRVQARASARLLAAMARVTGVTPDQLKKAEREDAARVLEEILRRETRPAAQPLRPAPVLLPPAAAGPAKDEVAEKILTDILLPRYGGNDVVRVMAGQRGTAPGTRVVQILRFLKDPELDREILAWLLKLPLDDSAAEVVRALGGQRGKRELMRVDEILEFLGWRPPLEAESGNGTTG